MSQINQHCRVIAALFEEAAPSIQDGTCTFCGSISPAVLERYLDDSEADAKWIEPLPGNMVTGVTLANGKRFLLQHLYDADVVDSDKLHQRIEDFAGNLQVYVRELNKYFIE